MFCAMPTRSEMPLTGFVIGNSTIETVNSGDAVPVVYDHCRERASRPPRPSILREIAVLAESISSDDLHRGRRT